MAMPMEEGMKKMTGSPGTWSGMALRVSQFVFATACFCAITVFDLSNLDTPAFWVSVCFICMKSMIFEQILWSLGLACIDIRAMRKKEVIHQRGRVIFFAVVDGIMAILIFTAASASAGALSLYYVGDADLCRKVACGQIVLSIVLGFITSLLAAISFVSMLRLQATLA